MLCAPLFSPLSLTTHSHNTTQTKTQHKHNTKQTRWEDTLRHLLSLGGGQTGGSSSSGGGATASSSSSSSATITTTATTSHCKTIKMCEVGPGQQIRAMVRRIDGDVIKSGAFVNVSPADLI